MPTIGGVHCQAQTERQIGYWASYDFAGPEVLFFVAVFSEGFFRSLGQFEGHLSCESGDIPAELRVRSAVLSYIDRTAFGEGKPPDPNWIGWRPGALL